MIQAFLYSRDSKTSENERLIMHRCYDSGELTVEKVLKKLENYVKEEQLNVIQEILIRIREDKTLANTILDLSDYNKYVYQFAPSDFPDCFPD
jgi:hypothetical protein